MRTWLTPFPWAGMQCLDLLLPALCRRRPSGRSWLPALLRMVSSWGNTGLSP